MIEVQEDCKVKTQLAIDLQAVNDALKEENEQLKQSEPSSAKEESKVPEQKIIAQEDQAPNKEVTNFEQIKQLYNLRTCYETLEQNNVPSVKAKLEAAIEALVTQSATKSDSVTSTLS